MEIALAIFVTAIVLSVVVGVLSGTSFFMDGDGFLGGFIGGTLAALAACAVLIIIWGVFALIDGVWVWALESSNS